MDRKTLIDALKRGAVRVHMNDGRHFDIPSLEFCAVDDIAAHVLVKDPEDNKWRGSLHLALVCMVSIEQIEHVAS